MGPYRAAPYASKRAPLHLQTMEPGQGYTSLPLVTPTWFITDRVWASDSEGFLPLPWNSTHLTKITWCVILVKSLWDLGFMGGRITWSALPQDSVKEPLSRNGWGLSLLNVHHPCNVIWNLQSMLFECYNRYWKAGGIGEDLSNGKDQKSRGYVA